MASPPHTRSVFAQPAPTGGSVVGSISLLVLLAAGVVAVGYPQMALAAAVGAVGTQLMLCVTDRIQSGQVMLPGASVPSRVVRS